VTTECFWRAVPCSPGQYKDSVDGAKCEECPNGKYQPNYGTRSCNKCPRFGTTVPGATSVEDCSGNSTIIVHLFFITSAKERGYDFKSVDFCQMDSSK